MKKLFFLMLVICTLASCDKDNGGENDGDNLIVVNDKNELRQIVYADELSRPNAIHFSTPGDWYCNVDPMQNSENEVQGPPVWIDIYPKFGDGAGDHTLNIYLAFNDTGEDRYATIYLATEKGGTPIDDKDVGLWRRIKVIQRAEGANGGTPIDPATPMSSEKMISAVIYNDDSGPNYSYRNRIDFAYDNKNRLASTLSIYDYQESGESNIHNWSIVKNEYLYLGNNKIIKVIRSETHNRGNFNFPPDVYSYYRGDDGYIADKDTNTGFTYDGGNLKKSTFYEHGIKPNRPGTEGSNYTYTWENGNLTGWKLWVTDSGDWEVGCDLKYGSTINKNTCNIDVSHFVEAQWEDMVMFINDFGGKRSVNLPSEVSLGKRLDLPGSGVPSYRYVTDEQGYVTEIYVKYKLDDAQMESESLKCKLLYK